MSVLSSNILISQMTSVKIREMISAGYDTVVITSGSMEQHGAHLPIETDTILATELAVRSAQQIGNTLVAPVISIGCSDHHMSFSGTATVPEEVFGGYVEGVADSMARHGFKRLLMTSFHGGNFAPTMKAVERLRQKHSELDIRAALDLSKLFQVTNGVIRRAFPERTAFDCHAGCVETSMMLYLNPEYVAEDKIQNGAEVEEWPKFQDLKEVTKNGVWGIVDGYSVEIGKRLFNAIIKFMLESWEYK